MLMPLGPSWKQLPDPFSPSPGIELQQSPRTFEATVASASERVAEGFPSILPFTLLWRIVVHNWNDRWHVFDRPVEHEVLMVTS